MAITYNVIPDNSGVITALAATDKMTTGQLVTYDQAAGTATLGVDEGYNAITIGNAFGEVGNQQIALQVIAARGTAGQNLEWYLQLGGTVSLGDKIVAGTGALAGFGELATVGTQADAALLVAMSAGVANQAITVQQLLV